MVVSFQLDAYLKMENGEKVLVHKSVLKSVLSTVSLKDVGGNWRQFYFNFSMAEIETII